MVLGASLHSVRPNGRMLTEEKPAAILPWQEVMSENELFISCHYPAVWSVAGWRASFLRVLLTTVFKLYLLLMMTK